MLRTEEMVEPVINMRFDKIPHICLIKFIATVYLSMIKQAGDEIGYIMANISRPTSNFMYNYPCRVLASTIKGKFLGKLPCLLKLACQI